MTCAPLFTGEALQKSSSYTQLIPSHAPLLSPGTAPLGQTWLKQGTVCMPAAKGFTGVQISRFLITFSLNRV